MVINDIKLKALKRWMYKLIKTSFETPACDYEKTKNQYTLAFSDSKATLYKLAQ